MIAGVRGRLITASFAATELPLIVGDCAPPRETVRALQDWSARREAAFGPTSSARAIADGIAIPLLKILGFAIIGREDANGYARLAVGLLGTALAPVVVAGWNDTLDAAWRDSILDAVRADQRWVFVFNGSSMRIVDAHRTWSRRYLEFDLALLAHDDGAFTLLWRLARAESLAAVPQLLDRAVELSGRYGTAVCTALADGVLEALELLLRTLAPRSRRMSSITAPMLEQALTVVYRILFLLFAEARGLVPVWHPVYRDRYTIDSIVSTLLMGRRYRGVWCAINAISRLAHTGCTAGELKVTAFNGRLFSPAATEHVDRTAIDDEVMSKAVLSVSTITTSRSDGRRRIVYRDLDVEELGAVYEHVLDYEPQDGQLARTRDLRKSTGAFYTPRALTSHIVRETLRPLIAGRSAGEILRLRVLDPAMGSGAFLVSACTQLAEAAEEAMIREGRWQRSEVTQADRTALRREIAQRCLFGVDLNPTAVQVARLSLWLTTLAADKPLTFLDHRLVTGNSLVGASAADVERQPAGSSRPGKRQREGSLLQCDAFAPALQHAVLTRAQLAAQADETAAIVRAKEKTLSALLSADGPLGRCTQVLDLWCAGWFWPDDQPPQRGTFGDLVDLLLERRNVLPARIANPLLNRAREAAAEHRFLHWLVTFPEVFIDSDGNPLADGGFDAIVGNPPWDMVRGDSGEGAARASRRTSARQLTRFVRESGIYRIDARSHVNRCQLFLERALHLARSGGRIGFVLPAGTVTDGGCAPLRQHLFNHAAIDTIVGFDNRHRIFPIHRSVRFVAVTATNGAKTNSVRCRFGVGTAEELEHGAVGTPQSVQLTRAFIARLSGEDDLAIPEIHGEVDLHLLERVSACVPTLQDGWKVAFGRELNATDDRHLFEPLSRRHAQARPVLEGKQIEPFRASIDGCRYHLRADANVRIGRRPRLAYRDVASATNRLTLIAAIIPADAVTTHTLFCLKTALPLDTQHVLSALLNSFVANYLIRFRVNTHVTVSLVSRLRVPTLERDSRAFRRLSTLAQTLMHSPALAEQQPEYAELQGLVARLYGLSEAEFAHILATFPLIPDEIRSAALAEFNNLR
jgi:Eco57I restriction-modification methylase